MVASVIAVEPKEIKTIIGSPVAMYAIFIAEFATNPKQGMTGVVAIAKSALRRAYRNTIIGMVASAKAAENFALKDINFSCEAIKFAKLVPSVAHINISHIRELG
jgi:hypothetical protein